MSTKSHTRTLRQTCICAIAILQSDEKARVKWRAYFVRDGVRCFWFDNQFDLETFIRHTAVDLILLNMPDMVDVADIEYYFPEVYCLSDNPDDIDISTAYGHGWLPTPMDASTARIILRKIGR